MLVLQMKCDSFPQLKSVEFFLQYFTQYSLCIKIHCKKLYSWKHLYLMTTSFKSLLLYKPKWRCGILCQLDKIYSFLGDGHACGGIILIILVDVGRPILIMGGTMRKRRGSKLHTSLYTFIYLF